MSSRSVRRRVVALTSCAVILCAACSGGGGHKTGSSSSSTSKPAPGSRAGIHKIKHVVVIMQENRSFDNYFGTFPGADGIPMKNGVPTVCLPNAATGQCERPYVDHSDVNGGGPHDLVAAFKSINRGKMNGFLNVAEQSSGKNSAAYDPICGTGPVDVMGYHTQRDIPNYWSYANNFVLQDHMFSPTVSWSLPAHLFQVSEWSATCKNHAPASCRNDNEQQSSLLAGPPTNWLKRPAGSPGTPIYAWTDLTYLLHKHHVPWGYYVVAGTEPDCEDDAAVSCAPVKQGPLTPGIWNPLPYFDTVHEDHELGKIQSVQNFYEQAGSGSLPAVSWVVPSGDVSEHPPSSVSAGQAYVTSLVNAVMRGPDWDSTAIFVSWDDWGGFYDHAVPPRVDRNGYGLRVPGLVISPYAKRGYVDHQTLSFDAYVKFIEDDFLGGERLDPATDGRPDPRPTVREDVGILGNLVHDFDFTQRPNRPLLLPVHPRSTLAASKPFASAVPKAVPGVGLAVVRWTPPVSDGGAPILGYTVTSHPTGHGTSSQELTSANEVTFSGLGNGESYTFTVAATNRLGRGLESQASQPVSIGAPSEVQAVRVKLRGREATLTWQPPITSGAAEITSYEITPVIGLFPIGTHSFPATARTGTIRLPPGRTYRFQVVAVNRFGSGVRVGTRQVTVAPRR